MVVKNFKASREDMDMTQQEVADIFDLSNSTVSGWETGKDTIPIDKLIKYANEFSLSLDYLFGIISKNEECNPFELDLELMAKNLTELREKNNYTQTKLAEKLNTTQPAYSHYETGTYKIPTTFLFALTKIYKPFSIDELFGREFKKKKTTKKNSK